MNLEYHTIACITYEYYVTVFGLRLLPTNFRIPRDDRVVIARKNKSASSRDPLNKKAAYITVPRHKKRRVCDADSFCSFLMGNGWRAGVGENRDVHRRALMTGPVTHLLARSRLVKILQVHLAFVGFRSCTTLTSTFSRRYQDTFASGTLVLPPGGKEDVLQFKVMAASVTLFCVFFWLSRIRHKDCIISVF